MYMMYAQFGIHINFILGVLSYIGLYICTTHFVERKIVNIILAKWLS